MVIIKTLYITIGCPNSLLQLRSPCLILSFEIVLIPSNANPCISFLFLPGMLYDLSILYLLT